MLTELESNNIEYVYDASGIKLQKKVSRYLSGSNLNTVTTDYDGGFIYETEGNYSATNGLGNNIGLGLQFFAHAEGYVEPNGNNFDYIYQYKDHLGNIRLSYKQGISDLEIVEENNYYPFGLKHKGYNSNVTSTNPALKRKYNGIELEDALGLDLYEMDMRQYDPAIARWTSIDPVIHYEYSTYSAFDNNPIFWADPSGANSESDLDKWVNKINAEWHALDNGASIRDVWGSGNMNSNTSNDNDNSSNDVNTEHGNDPDPIQIFMSFKFENFKKFVFEIGAQWSLKLDGNSKLDAAISARMEADLNKIMLGADTNVTHTFGLGDMKSKSNVGYNYNVLSGKGKGSAGTSLNYSATSGSPYANQYNANAKIGMKYGFSGKPTWYLQSGMSGINSALNPTGGFTYISNTLSTSNFKSYSSVFNYMQNNFSYKMKLAKLKL